MPTFFQRVRNFCFAIYSAIRAGLARERVVCSEDVLQARDCACMVCPHLAGIVCTKCGCVQSLKIMLATEKCPDRRWFPQTRFSRGI